MEISVMTYGHPLWDKTISFAENCSWKAGAFLANMMRNKEFSETERVIAASEDGKIIGYCTFAMKDELPDDVEYSPFIGFVFVDEGSRGKRVSLFVLLTFGHSQLVTTVVVGVLRMAFDPVISEGVDIGKTKELVPEIGIQRRFLIALYPAPGLPAPSPALFQTIDDILGVGPKVHNTRLLQDR